MTEASAANALEPDNAMRYDYSESNMEGPPNIPRRAANTIAYE